MNIEEMPPVQPVAYTGKRLLEFETLRIFGLRGNARWEAIARLNVEEARALKRSARAKAKRAEARRQREEEARRRATAIQFSGLYDWVTQRRPADAFTLKLTSTIANVSRTFNFRAFEHFENWFNLINNDELLGESETIRTYSDATGDENVFNVVIPEITAIQGGCSDEPNRTIVKETPYYSLKLFSPLVRHNNCGFKVLEHILHRKLDYSAERKELGVEQEKKLTPEQVSKIYAKYSKKVLCFIDENFNETINKYYDYVFIRKDHYYYVEEATYKAHSDKHTKRGYLFWDIETRKTEEYVLVGANKSYKLKDTILCAYYCGFQGSEWKKITFITNSEKSSCRQFLDWLSVESNDGHCYNCVAHNGSRFDHYFLLSYLTEQEQLHTETQLRGCSIIGMQFKSHLFKDSCCYLTNSLDNLCKAFKVAQSKLTEFVYDGKALTNKNICFYKPELTFDEFMALRVNEPEYWGLYEEYCMYDCIGLKCVWLSFREQYNKLIENVFQYAPSLLSKVQLEGTNTIGSLSKKILEQTCLERNGTGFRKTKAYSLYLQFVQKANEGKRIIDEEKIDFIKKFKRGGVSHCNQPGKHTHSLISYDIASQYPASMIYMLIPAGESVWVTEYKPYATHGYYHLKNVVFDGRAFKPVAKYCKEEALDWGQNTIDEVYLDSFMIKYLQKNCGLVSFDVEKGLVSRGYVRGEEIFGRYVNTLYNQKKEQDRLKDTKDASYNPALRECIKLFLNSLSGKLVEDPSRYFSLNYVGGEQKLTLNGIGIEKELEKTLNIWVGAGCMVYSYSKRLLFEYVNCLPDKSNDVIHTETDSIYFNKKHQEAFVKNITEYKNSEKVQDGYYPVMVGSDLGNVKVEKDTSEVSYFLGKKFYCIGDLYKIKGIPLDTIDENGNKKVLVDVKLYEEVYNWKEGDKPVKREFYTMKKALFDEKTYISSHMMSRTVRPNCSYSLYTD